MRVSVFFNIQLWVPSDVMLPPSLEAWRCPRWRSWKPFQTRTTEPPSARLRHGDVEALDYIQVHSQKLADIIEAEN